jgi:hypothetical protein
VRIARIFVVGAAAAMVGLVAGPAAAAPSDSTTTTFEVLAGTLDIDTPASATIGTGGAPGTVINGSLGAVTVSDTRAAADASWLASVVSTVYSTGTGTPTQTILASEVDYWSGPAISTTGTGTFTPGQLAFADRDPLDTVTPLTAFTHAGGTGNNTAVWNPGISVNVPLDSEAGVYSGTVTHSVA